jgi:hypothetical protein
MSSDDAQPAIVVQALSDRTEIKSNCDQIQNAIPYMLKELITLIAEYQQLYYHRFAKLTNETSTWKTIRPWNEQSASRFGVTFATTNKDTSDNDYGWDVLLVTANDYSEHISSTFVANEIMIERYDTQFVITTYPYKYGKVLETQVSLPSTDDVTIEIKLFGCRATIIDSPLSEKVSDRLSSANNLIISSVSTTACLQPTSDTIGTAVTSTN